MARSKQRRSLPAESLLITDWASPTVELFTAGRYSAHLFPGLYQHFFRPPSISSRTLSVATHMLAHRSCLTAGIVLGIVVVYCLLPDTIELLGGGSSHSTGMADLTLEDLSVRLHGNSEGQTTVVKVTIENTHPTRTVTLLRWDTPLDKSCFRTGVLTITETATGESVQGPGMKINRKLPPAREELVEIPAKGAVGEDLVLNEPWMPSDGRSVKIVARGSWRAVWAKAIAEVTVEELQAMTGEGMLQGAFVSETDVELKSDG